MRAAPGRGGRRAGLFRQALAIACVAVLLVAARLASERGRVALPGTTVVRVADGPGALDVWRRAGVRGRTLVHLARKIAMRAEAHRPGVSEVSEENYLYAALRESVIRRVYHVIPDGDWPEVERNLADFPGAGRSEHGFRLEMEGAPVIVLRARDLPRLREPVLVNVDVDRWSADALREIVARLVDGAPPDVVTWWSEFPPASGPEEAFRVAAR